MRRRGRRRPAGRLGAGPTRRQRRRLRAGRLHPLRAGEGRRPPADRGGARGRRSDGAARGARGPLRRAARAAAQPDRAAAGADQARTGRRPRGHVPRRPARGDADRARFGAGQADPAEIPEALYESGKSQLSMRVPEDPSKRFPAVVRAADVLLAVTREAAMNVTGRVRELVTGRCGRRSRAFKARRGSLPSAPQ